MRLTTAPHPPRSQPKRGRLALAPPSGCGGLTVTRRGCRHPAQLGQPAQLGPLASRTTWRRRAARELRHGATLGGGRGRSRRLQGMAGARWATWVSARCSCPRAAPRRPPAPWQGAAVSVLQGTRTARMPGGTGTTAETRRRVTLRRQRGPRAGPRVVREGAQRGRKQGVGAVGRRRWCWRESTRPATWTRP